MYGAGGMKSILRDEHCMLELVVLFYSAKYPFWLQNILLLLLSSLIFSKYLQTPLPSEGVRLGYLGRAWAELMARDSSGENGQRELPAGGAGRSYHTGEGETMGPLTAPWGTDNLSKLVWENNSLFFSQTHVCRGNDRNTWNKSEKKAHTVKSHLPILRL